MENRSFLGFTTQELRIIGISLSILSLGTAIAWIGIIYVTQKSSTPPQHIATPSAAIKTP